MSDEGSRDAAAREAPSVAPLSIRAGWVCALWAAAVSGLYLAVRELGLRIVP